MNKMNIWAVSFGFNQGESWIFSLSIINSHSRFYGRFISEPLNGKIKQQQKKWDDVSAPFEIMKFKKRRNFETTLQVSNSDRQTTPMLCTLIERIGNNRRKNEAKRKRRMKKKNEIRFSISNCCLKGSNHMPYICTKWYIPYPHNAHMCMMYEVWSMKRNMTERNPVNHINGIAHCS